MDYNLISFILTIVGTVLSVLSIAYAIITTKRNKKQEKNTKTIHWAELLTASKYISKKLKNDSFIPDIILTPGQKGGIFAQLIIDDLDLEIPILTGFIIPIVDTNYRNISLEQYIHLKTTKWHIFLPNVISNYKDSKILIVDDFVMSGDFLFTTKNSLDNSGFEMHNIKCSSIVTTKVAISSNKSPDYFWKIVDSDDCYFPWGKAK